jgi:hypothetical protein
VSFLREIGTQILAVGQNPLLYQLRLEIGEGARMAIVGRYVILFHTMGEVVRIERVVYGLHFVKSSLRSEFVTFLNSQHFCRHNRIVCNDDFYDIQKSHSLSA